MKFVSQTYTLTQADINAQAAVIHLSWRSAFASTEYVCTWAIEDIGPNPAGTLNLIPADKHNVTTSGLDVVVYILGASTAGDQLIVHAMAGMNTPF